MEMTEKQTCTQTVCRAWYHAECWLSDLLTIFCVFTPHLQTLLGSTVDAFHLVYKREGNQHLDGPYVLCICNDPEGNKIEHFQIFSWVQRTYSLMYKLQCGTMSNTFWLLFGFQACSSTQTKWSCNYCLIHVKINWPLNGVVWCAWLSIRSDFDSGSCSVQFFCTGNETTLNVSPSALICIK